MKGFKITCKSEKGEEVLLQDVNANKKVFDIVDVKQKPFLTTTYLFKKRSTVKMAFKMLKPEHLALLKGLTMKLRCLING
jgi:hypothetical protein